MKPLRVLFLMVAMMLMIALVACGGGAATETPAATETTAEEPAAEEPAAEEPAAEEPAASAGAGLGMEAAAVAEQFFSQEDLDNSIRLMGVTPDMAVKPQIVTAVEESL